jgi:recombinational DNA repair protein (RecF pathway)
VSTAFDIFLRPNFFSCTICGESVELETTKIDEGGKPVHEECYLRQVSLKWSIRPPPTAVDANFNQTPLSRAILALLNSASSRPLANSCPDCGSPLEHRQCSFFYRGQTWEIQLPICFNCHPMSDVPPDDA